MWKMKLVLLLQPVTSFGVERADGLDESRNQCAMPRGAGWCVSVDVATGGWPGQDIMRGDRKVLYEQSGTLHDTQGRRGYTKARYS